MQPSTDGSAALRRPSKAEPAAGDSVYVSGHGPAVVLQVSAARSDADAAFEVEYPNGERDWVERPLLLAHQASPLLRLASGSALGAGSAGSTALLSGAAAAATAAATAAAASASTASPVLRRLSTGSVASGPRELEYLGRAFDSEARNISTASAVFSLVATMVGAAVLSFPFALSQCGLILGTVALAGSAVASTWTMQLLVDCARATGCDTFELVGHAAFGEPARRLTVVLVFVLCWLGLVGYTVILGDLLVPILEVTVSPLRSFQPRETLRRLVLCGVTLLAGPMCFKQGFRAVRLLCFASVASVFVAGAVIGVRGWPNCGQMHYVEVMLPSRATMPVLVGSGGSLWPTSWLQALYVFPTFGLGFMGHFNVLPMHRELLRPTRWRVHRVLYIANLIPTLFYLFVATSGYVYAGGVTCGNVFLNFRNDDPVVLLGRVALALVLMLNFPLYCQPCRNALFRLLASSRCCSPAAASAFDADAGDSRQHEVSLQPVPEEPSSFSSSSSAEAPVASPSPPVASAAHVHVYRREDTRRTRDHPSGLAALDSFLPKDDTVQQSAAEPTTRQRFVLTAVLLGSALLVSCTVQSLFVVISIMGSTAGFAVAFVLPAAFWYRLVGVHKGVSSRSAAAILAGLFAVLAVVCTCLTVANLGAPPCPLEPE